jgi:hypothetical protein
MGVILSGTMWHKRRLAQTNQGPDQQDLAAAVAALERQSTELLLTENGSAPAGACSTGVTALQLCGHGCWLHKHPASSCSCCPMHTAL